MTLDLALAALFFVVAVLYATVGHGGASGYMAAMVLLGVAPAAMKPTALVLNLLVAGIGTVRFARAGSLPLRKLAPFLAASVPAAFLGGTLHLGAHGYKQVVGLVLLWSAVQLARTLRAPTAAAPPRLHLTLPVALVCGAAIGLISGLTGIGGGILLSPLVILTGWAQPREASGMATVFILANSAAGLAGNLASTSQLPAHMPMFAVTVIVGGWIGSGLGSQRLPLRAIRGLLAVVLVTAGVKLLTDGS